MKKEIIEKEEHGLKIAILNRGWVMIGNFNQTGEMCHLSNASVIRRWGTDKRLGQLAIEGKQNGTILDFIGEVDFHILTTVAIVDVDTSKWT